MQCEEAINLISARLDNEIDPDDAHRLEAHLSECGDCRATAEAINLQDAQLARAFAPRRDAAAAIAARVVSELRPRGTGRFLGWVHVAVAAAAGVALALVLMKPAQ